MATFDSVEKLIRAARNGRSQKEFAALLGVDQSMVSKYERGKINPPISFINGCMRLVHTAEGEVAPTAEQLAERVRVTLSDPNLGQVRSAMSRLVDAVASEHTQSRTAGTASQ
ncbi:hypothetical protein FACS1894154_01280 [Betaproteobacteria bacterium]|nr:hypothetical protein FACS1894154_01280 [Betaproteobacteria bacterium]